MEKFYSSQLRTKLPSLALGEQILDESYSLGKSLKGPHREAGEQGSPPLVHQRRTHLCRRCGGGLLHEPVEDPRVLLAVQAVDLRLGRGLCGAVSRLLCVAVPPAVVRAPVGSVCGAQRGRRCRWDGDQPGGPPSRHCHEPVRKRVLPRAEEDKLGEAARAEVNDLDEGMALGFLVTCVESKNSKK